MSDQPNQPNRPWLLRGKRQSWRTGEWGKVRTLATYATEESGVKGMEEYSRRWMSTAELYLCHRDSREGEPLSPTDGADSDPPKVRTPNLHTEKDHGHG